LEARSGERALDPPSSRDERTAKMLRTYRATGEIDLATAPALTADLRDTVDASDEVLVSVDCSDVTFMDSSGFHALVDATDYAARQGHTLVIRDLSPSCRRLIRICDVDHELRI
jgi:anti-anti-sigma factor